MPDAPVVSLCSSVNTARRRRVQQFVVVRGNPVKGITIHGPFAAGDSMNEWAARHGAQEWWLVPLQSPDEG